MALLFCELQSTSLAAHNNFACVLECGGAPPLLGRRRNRGGWRDNLRFPQKRRNTAALQNVAVIPRALKNAGLVLHKNVFIGGAECWSEIPRSPRRPRR